jgi:hypothetical protein
MITGGEAVNTVAFARADLDLFSAASHDCNPLYLSMPTLAGRPAMSSRLQAATAKRCAVAPPLLACKSAAKTRLFKRGTHFTNM